MLLLLSTPERAEIWRRVFADQGEAIATGLQDCDPSQVTHLACWLPPADLGIFPALRAVISTGAGVDHFPPLPDGVTLARTIAPGIEGMVRDWVVMATLMLHRDMPRYLAQQRRGEWQGGPVALARNRRVGIMGMGRIGALAAETLTGLGFAVRGWSRSGAPVPGAQMFGQDGLAEFLGGCDILICLLPLTPQTQGILDAELFAQLPEGAGLVHAGRGAQLDMDAMRAALDAGQLSGAVLDVTNPEPLPQDHWAWADPRLIITPHVGAMTDAEEGAQHALAVIRADRAGQPIPGKVDPARGY